MAQQWQSYDKVADSHDRLAVPNVFARPAQDVVNLIQAASARGVLDVGSGTGVAALEALKVMRPGALVVALDPSLGMLQKARAKGLQLVIAGKVPGLPFRNAAFDCVIANFVLNHLSSYEAALADMARVLRKGGRLGVAVWGPLETEVRKHWRNKAESFAGREVLTAAMREVLPWEDWFSNPVNLGDALRGAGLGKVMVESRQYASRMSIADFLALRQGLGTGRFLQANLAPEEWRRFQGEVAEEFRQRFPDPLEDIRDAHIATGVC